MTDENKILTDILSDRLGDGELGILVRGISGINPYEISSAVAQKLNRHIYASSIGINATSFEDSQVTISTNIETAVKWRSNPLYAGAIIVFIYGDVEKLHSLADFGVISYRDMSLKLIDNELSKDSINDPTRSFWKALRDTINYYSYELIADFITTIDHLDKPDAIPQNLWRLNLLNDFSLLSTNHDIDERLSKNRDLIAKIGLMSDASRKKIAQSLVKSDDNNRQELQETYRNLLEYFKYGHKETLKSLNYDSVSSLLNGSSKKKKSKNPKDTSDTKVIMPKEFTQKVADILIDGTDEQKGDLTEIVQKIQEKFESDSDESKDPIENSTDTFDNRPVTVPAIKSDLRSFISKLCDNNIWGGRLTVKETVLKDIISIENPDIETFDPNSVDSIINSKAIMRPGTRYMSFFDFLRSIDYKINLAGSPFSTSIAKIEKSRSILASKIDMLTWYPLAILITDDSVRENLFSYIDAWNNIYQTLNNYKSVIISNSSSDTFEYIAKTLLSLDSAYIHTSSDEWKGILLPLNPMYLWKYYEVFKSIDKGSKELDESDKKALKKVLPQLPQVLNYLVVSDLINETGANHVLPCSGSIESLPTFENKTNRYLGDDGIDSIETILKRWVAYAPYTKNEIRICTVDAPNHLAIFKILSEFISSKHCKHIVYDIYLTRNQNGNRELAKIDYAQEDYEIAEMIESNQLSISIHNVVNGPKAQEEIRKNPVHIAFYFDQSAYGIEYGPKAHYLYINPLVVTYDYKYDNVTHRGTIYPSSNTDTGLIGSYHKALLNADLVKNDLFPHTVYSINGFEPYMKSTIKEGAAQWLVIADREIDNYNPESAILIGEKEYDRRKIGIWISTESRVILDYDRLLRSYNISPQKQSIQDLLQNFGHITAPGMISIPEVDFADSTVQIKRKGLIGTLLGATWYRKANGAFSLIASLDDEKTRLWLSNRPDEPLGNDRADLIGLTYNSKNDILTIQPIEVKTRDESPDAIITENITSNSDISKPIISGHAPDQIASTASIISSIFNLTENSSDMFINARREVFKYQIISECFRHTDQEKWQYDWSKVFNRIFSKDLTNAPKIEVKGILLHFKLSESSAGKQIACVYSPKNTPIDIDFYELTAKDVQESILGSSEAERPKSNTSPNTILPFRKEIASSTHQIDTSPLNPKPQNPVHEKVAEPVNSFTKEVKPEKKNNPNLPEKTNLTVQNPQKKDFTELKSSLVKSFISACGSYAIGLKECEAKNVIIGPKIIRIPFRLARGQTVSKLRKALEDIGREMRKTDIVLQNQRNSDVLYLDIPREQGDPVLYQNVQSKIPAIESLDQLPIALGQTPEGTDVIEYLNRMPHLLVGGSTGSGKTIFLETLLAALLKTHPKKDDIEIILMSSKFEDFSAFHGLPQLFGGDVIKDASRGTLLLRREIYEESQNRGNLFNDAGVPNLAEYNKISSTKIKPIVVVIDEFADLVEQLDKKDKEDFFNPVLRIAQTGRNRGIHLILCTQRPEANLVPTNIRSQLNARVALRVNDKQSSYMILGDGNSSAISLQKHGDMIFKSPDHNDLIRAQGYYISPAELRDLCTYIKNLNKA